MWRPGGPALFDTEEFCSLLCLTTVSVWHLLPIAASLASAVNCLLTCHEMTQKMPLESSFHAVFQRPSDKISTTCQPDSGIQMASVAQRCVRQEITQRRGLMVMWCNNWRRTLHATAKQLQHSQNSKSCSVNYSGIWSLSTFGIQQHATKMHHRLEQNLLQILFKCQLKLS